MTVAADVRLNETELRAKQISQERKSREDALLRKDLNETFATASGLRTLRWLMNLCGYQRPSVTADQNGSPVLEGTIYNEARRNIYLSIRQMLKQEILIPVENKGLAQDEMDLFS